MHTIGIIGTGEIGWRMGRLLKEAGHDVIGFDIRPEALERPKASGFRIVGGIAELCREADPVITCVTDGSALRNAVEGEGGVRASLPAGRTVIDTTSAEPWISGDIAKGLEAAGIAFIDAPVSGGVPAADTGKMNFMVGGAADVLDRWRPLLGCLGPVVTHVGPVGAGHTIKAINMLALASSMLATTEVLAIGQALGFTLEQLVDSLNDSAGASFCTRVHYPRFIVPGNYGSGFAFDLMRKDLSIAIGLAERAGLPLIVGRTAWELYRVAAATGLEGADNTRLVDSVLTSVGTARTESDTTSLPQLVRLAEATNLVVAAEALALGASAGLAPATVIQVLGASSGDSHVLSQRLPPYLDGHKDAPAPSLQEVWQDAAAATTCGLTSGVSTFLCGATVAILAAATRHYGGEGSSHRVVDQVVTWARQTSRVLRQ